MIQRHKIFCNHYLLHFNATDAAKHAGYSDKNATNYGYRLLQLPVIKGYLSDRIKSAMDAELDPIKKRILDLWVSFAFENASSDTKDQLKASELLAKYSGILVDNPTLNLNTNDDINLIIKTIPRPNAE